MKPHRLSLTSWDLPFANKTARRGFIRHLTKFVRLRSGIKAAGNGSLAFWRFNAGENNEPVYYGGCVGVYRVSYLRGRLRGVAPEQQNSAAVTTADFVPRIRVIKEDSFTTATVCHQCEDAPCANVCPVQAIRRDRGHIFVTSSRCIGCKKLYAGLPVWRDDCGGVRVRRAGD